MPDARWRQIEHVCETVLAVDPAMRAAFLDEACAGDADLRREVESLLAQQSRADGFLDVPAIERADAGGDGSAREQDLNELQQSPAVARQSPSLVSGTKLGPYEVVAPLGAGGMGEVYRARDTRLARTVALKILPEGLAADPDRRRRFEHEARAASALNHPHICTLYDVGEGIPSTPASRAPNPESRVPNPVSVSYLVMEHLDGETLAARIARGPLPTADVLMYGAQIADALSAAHRGGIVHRDLKPGNVMLTGNGGHRSGARAVRLLDFGLAKLKSAAGAGASAEVVGAEQASLTAPGQIIGTLPYMAPEQVEGREADARTDIWALGAMLYEKVTGTRAFQAATSASLTAAILEHEPAPISSAQPGTPVALERLIRKCLAKDPDARWQSARDVADELQWMREPAGNGTATTVTPPAGRRRSRALAAAVVVGATAIGAIAIWLLHPGAPGPAVARLSLEVGPAETLSTGGAGPVYNYVPTPGGARTAFAWTPDGRSLVFVGQRAGVYQLFVRRLDTDEARPVPGTEGAQLLAVSPNGQWLAFWAGGVIRKVPLGGGPVTSLLSGIAVLPSGLAWDGGDGLYFDRNDGRIWRLRPGEEPRAVTTVGATEAMHVLPSLLPGDRVLLYTVRKRRWTWGDEEIAAQDLTTGERTTLLTDAADARFTTSGHLAFMRRGQLCAVAFDADRVAIRGTPQAVLDGVAQALVADTDVNLRGAGQFAVASTGALAWLPGQTEAYPDATLVSVDRRGRVSPMHLPVRPIELQALSPDGRQMAATIHSQTAIGLWLYDLSRGTIEPRVRDGEVWFPIWTPDGRHVVFNWRINGMPSLARQRADGITPPEGLGTTEMVPSSFTPDGSELAAVEIPAHHVLTVAVGGAKAGAPRRLTNASETERWPVFSPDGRWIVYGSNGSGRFDLWIQRYPGNGPRWPVSVEGGSSPAWHPNGRDLFFISLLSEGGTCKMMSVSFEPGSPPRLGSPRELFEFNPRELAIACQPVRCYDVAPDGERFYGTRTGTVPPRPVVTHINLVQNWFEELKAKVPAGSK